MLKLRLVGLRALAQAAVLSAGIAMVAVPVATAQTEGEAPPAPATEPAGELPDAARQAVARAADVLPRTAAPESTVRHATGVEMTVNVVRFLEDRIVVDARVQNRHRDRRDVFLAYSGAIEGQRRILMRDDRGNTYPFTPDFTDDEVRIAAQRVVRVRLIFFGRIDPTATSLQLITNFQVPHGRTSSTPAPTMRFSVPVRYDEQARADATQAALEQVERSDERLPFNLPLQLQKTHANRSTVTVTGITFELDRIILDIRVANRLHVDEPITLFDGVGFVVLDDDKGNRHHVVTQPDDFLEVKPARVASGRLIFYGGVQPDARTLTLRTNWLADGPRSSGTDDASRSPALELPPIPVAW